MIKEERLLSIILISGAFYILISILRVIFSALPSDLKPSQFVMMSTMLKYTRLQMLSFLFQKTILIHELPMYEDSIICELKEIAKNWIIAKITGYAICYAENFEWKPIQLCIVK